MVNMVFFQSKSLQNKTDTVEADVQQAKQGLSAAEDTGGERDSSIPLETAGSAAETARSLALCWPH